MKLTITITTSNTDAHITEEQMFFVKSELDAICRRLSDPTFVETMKKKVQVDPLVGGVGYPHYDLSVQHVVEEGRHSIQL